MLDVQDKRTQVVAEFSSNLSRKDAKWHKGNENLFRVGRNPVRGAAKRWPDFC